jgi:hypothetical protein
LLRRDGDVQLAEPLAWIAGLTDGINQKIKVITSRFGRSAPYFTACTAARTFRECDEQACYDDGAESAAGRADAGTVCADRVLHPEPWSCRLDSVLRNSSPDGMTTPHPVN